MGTKSAAAVESIVIQRLERRERSRRGMGLFIEESMGRFPKICSLNRFTYFDYKRDVSACQRARPQYGDDLLMVEAKMLQAIE
jgi:hypothetical protein